MQILRPAKQGNYLRVRGEYRPNAEKIITRGELPPRTRRILELYDVVKPGNGTTSAYAENTFAVSPRPRTPGNYLRVRGEYLVIFASDLNTGELPPRTRRIHEGKRPAQAAKGTTSAYAENTLNELGLL